jgi:hypothetical protein
MLQDTAPKGATGCGSRLGPCRAQGPNRVLVRAKPPEAIIAGGPTSVSDYSIIAA